MIEIKTVNLTNKKLNTKKKIIGIIGMFDGLHLGHMKLINEAFKYKRKTAVISFIKENGENNQLLSLGDKKRILKKMKIDYFANFDFDKIKSINYLKFIDLLQTNNINKLVCGKDFKLGFNREGSVENISKKIDIEVIDDVIINGLKVSTTLIKQLIKSGEIEKANSLLGYNFYNKGVVVYGNQIGRKLGYRTANINYSNQLVPKNGVYFSLVHLKNKKYYSITNVGYNPTINLQKEIRVETHILNFDKEIYGKEITIEYLKFLREEKKFNSKEELIKQLEDDENKALKMSEEGLN